MQSVALPFLPRIGIGGMGTTTSGVRCPFAPIPEDRAIEEKIGIACAGRDANSTSTACLVCWCNGQRNQSDPMAEGSGESGHTVNCRLLQNGFAQHWVLIPIAWTQYSCEISGRT